MLTREAAKAKKRLKLNASAKRPSAVVEVTVTMYLRQQPKGSLRLMAGMGLQVEGVCINFRRSCRK